ncbi:LacI family DNA-binding transcriptional regulator [Bacillus licheniformis]|jgi:LacI family sucrose operon transcriptional repressor|uniref:HTH-type transcriptional regulator DegA n=2 Tax=Bacillus licheniformis TaxID=1402 RepID=A0A415J9K4_BACLI|nr:MULTISPECIES: LacI family DNA-binding transcriptional regulator [Bacillus]MBY8348526.1 LacI family transcriptional regulator [Bacillus sp. PCH94]MDP4082866.1 LacI family DNA-binding transcriptional regulator [Bacillota bacterium]AKQ75460.1 transcriptional regulator [Bacillus licheniformis WX-02]AMR12501.1 LacI family transcriptional regulator [Bacillus licheniformis]AOP17412.1 Catabolite control protein [Bacillus licheniformis]
MKPNIHDVAKIAGVSPTTVSRVLNNRGYISEKTKERVYKAMEEINYFPNDLARSLFRKRTNLIGLIIPNSSNPFFGELAFHIESICTLKGYKLLLCNSLNRKDKEEKYLEMLIRNQVDGVIAVTFNRGILDYHKQNLPIVAIDHYLSNHIPVVGSDNYAGGKKATELLLEKGCKHIVHINGPLELETPANLRRKAYEDVMKEHGRKPVTYEVPFHQNYQEYISRLFDEQPNADGIFASDDLIAAAVLNQAKKRGIDIPNHLKVIGYDGTETVQSLLPDLTTIQQPIELISKKAIEILLKAVDGDFNDLPRETYLPVQVLEGKTT